MALLERLCAALLALPLLLCSPILRSSAARRRRASARRAAASIAEVAPEPRRAKRPPAALLRSMRDELRHELARNAAEGNAYPHLARFERQFSKVGLRVLEAVPVDHLRRALREFEAMVRNWSSPALADLRSRMAVTLADRTSASSVWIAANSVAPGMRGDALASQIAARASSIFGSSQQMLSRI
ncbi:MAG TPA: hypothetical protein VHM00_00325 [Caldimonas sp.]|jgi:hypothetical protein|nr:hypothetical protein [Caldimonas sp.]HEX2539509.1 hypothetical protein [Caldimonas sp.]